MPELALCATEQVSVWVSPEWLRLALDLVVDNAIEAMAGCAVQQLRIETAVSNTNLDIIVQDSGKGIPPELVPILFEYTEIREPRRGNLGRGLLMVQAILQTYGGDIRVHASSPSGTQMAMCLPVYEQVVTG